jgi:SAM-dependent methyltransferase
MSLEFTGERFVPGVQGQIEFEHWHRYLLATYLVRDKSVLDLACGEGYGSYLLSKFAKNVLGVDCSHEAICNAIQTYAPHSSDLNELIMTTEKLFFTVGECTAIPIESNCKDCVVSFETIEHIDAESQDIMMAEIVRVLKKDGILILSSPDKYNYSIKPGYTNPFHKHELSIEELKILMSRHFKNVVYFGQRVVYGSLIAQYKCQNFVNFTSDAEGNLYQTYGISSPIYWIAIASNGELPEVPLTFFEKYQ